MKKQWRNTRIPAASPFVTLAAALALGGSPPPANGAEPCADDQICGLKNAEDLVRLSDSHWAVASRLAKNPGAPGAFSLVDLDRRTAHALIPDVSTPAAAVYSECPGAPVASELITHGLDVRRQPNGASELFAVNHGGRESIEIFDLHVDEHDARLTWKGCVILAPDISANAVAALPDGMAVTSFGSPGPQGTAELIAGTPAGFVARWVPHQGWKHVAGSEFGGDNGVAAAADGSVLYVNDWTDGTLRLVPLRDGVAPATIELGHFHPDNIHFLQNGDLLIAGQVGTAGDIMSCVQTSACPVGSMAVVVNPKARRVLSRRAIEPTSTFGAASTALLYGHDYWLSSFRGDRIVRLAPEQVANYTSPLPTGVRLDAVGDRADLGSMPLGMAIAPGAGQLAVLLSGWRQQGVQIVDLKSLQVLQTLEQPAAFLGLAFSRDGTELFASGGNDDAIYCYSWRDGLATLERKIVLGDKAPDKPASHYPAGIASSRVGNYLYVAENMSDSLVVIDLGTSKVVQRFPTDHYPYGVEVVSNGKIFVSAWGADTLAEFRVKPDGLLIPAGKLKVGPRPSALVANRSGTRLFVALAGADKVAVVDAVGDRLLHYLSDAAPAGPSEGSTPNALALSSDESRLFVAEADNNAVAVFDVSEKQRRARSSPMVGRVPTDWYPSALLDVDGRLLVLNGKGQGTRPNPDGPTPGEGIKRPFDYALGQLNGTLRALPDTLSQDQLTQYSRRVAEANNWTVPRPRKRYPPFKHVVYIIKENRTYDQVLGDMPGGDGDPALVFFSEDVAPNHHGLARRFGLFDRFFTNAEVSSQGHIWSTAACTTDYGEKTVPSAYSDRRQDVDGEPVDEPLNGFLWTLAAKRKISFRDYGEMVNGPEGWPVTQHDLGSNISPTYPTFDLKIPDQTRADAWIAELRTFAHEGKMPALEILHLPADHTAGGRVGYPTPRAYMADNDLALGRIVEALSTSPFWKDTVIFVLEDDSQAGPDHVDSHRSPFYAISAYNRPGTQHRFANTTDVVAAIEDILGLGRLCKFDYFSRSLADVFAPTPDYSPWTALVPRQDRNETNAPATAAARLSERLDFSAPDRVDDALFNQILWGMLKGANSPPPASTRAPVEVYQLSRQ